MSSLVAAETIPVAVSALKPTEHWNNWPNDKGFDPEYEQLTPVELSVSGQIPSYAAGTLYRTGPGKSQVKTEDGQLFQMSHWFDGFTQTHRFQIISPNDNSSSTKVLYNSHFSTDALIEYVRKTGNLTNLSFGQKRDPCKTVFNKVQTEFEPPSGASAWNTGVTLSVNMPGIETSSEEQVQSTERWADSKGIQTLWAKTDYNMLKQLDPETLEPIGTASQDGLHPELTGPMTASHARSDPLTGDMFNYNLSFGPTSTYKVFKVSALTGKTTILATFPGTPSYLHSLNITEDYVILCVWNSHMIPAEIENGSFKDSIMPTDPAQPATWYVVDRKQDRGLVATYESPAFFAFHTIGAYQEPSKEHPGEVDIIADLVRTDSSEFINRFLIENMMSSLSTAKAFVAANETNSGTTFSRFRLPALPSMPNSEPLKATLEWSACEALSPELPTMNPKYVTQKYRYTYAVGLGSESTFTSSIIKFDMDTQEVCVWAVHGHSPGEPIFVPNPAGEREDDGVLLSVVLDGFKGYSYLLCLDAQTLNELGRANVNGAVGFNFHGQHVPSKGLPTGDY